MLWIQSHRIRYRWYSVSTSFVYTSYKMAIYFVGSRKGDTLGDTGAYPAGGFARNPLGGAPSRPQ